MLLLLSHSSQVACLYTLHSTEAAPVCSAFAQKAKKVQVIYIYHPQIAPMGLNVHISQVRLKPCISIKSQPFLFRNEQTHGEIATFAFLK